jgi:hypothetical protein
MGKYQELKEKAENDAHNANEVTKRYYGNNPVRAFLFNEIHNVENPMQFKAAIPLSHYPRDLNGIFKPTLFVEKRKNEGWRFRTQDTNRTSINLEIAMEKFPEVKKAVEKFGEERDFDHENDLGPIYELVDQELNGEDNND